MQTVLITGASSGFGRELAKKLAGEGKRLVLVARRLEKLEELKRELDTDVYIARVDVRKRSEVEQFVNDLPDDYRDIDILVNNAGLALGIGLAPEADLEDWEAMIDTNVKGLVYFTHALMSQMVERKSGHIVNLGSVSGNWPYPGSNVYGATKAFVQQFSRNLRTDLLGKNIKVTNIEPGPVETEFSIVRFKGNEERAAQVYQGTNGITAKQIAEVIAWIINMPPELNVSAIEIVPTGFAFAGFAVDRQS